MKKRLIIQPVLLLALLILAFASSSCTGILTEQERDSGQDVIAEARACFEEDAVRYAEALESLPDDVKDSCFPFTPGDIIPFWTEAERNYNRETRRENVEVPIETHFLYYAQYPDSTGAFSIRVRMFSRLVLSKDDSAGRFTPYLLYYAAEPKYAFNHRGNYSMRLDNSGGDLLKYSGLKIYTDLAGSIVRVNKYRNGAFVDGVLVSRDSGEGLARFFEGIEVRRGYHPRTKSFSEYDDCEMLPASICIAEVSSNQDTFEYPSFIGVPSDPEPENDSVSDDDDNEEIGCDIGEDQNADEKGIEITVTCKEDEERAEKVRTHLRELLAHDKYAKILEPFLNSGHKINIKPEKAGRAAEYNTKTKDINVFQTIYKSPLMEEALHYIQCTSGHTQTTADKEFEAKCMHAYFFENRGERKEYNTPIDERHYNSFKEYIESPSQETYDAACGYLNIFFNDGIPSDVKGDYSLTKTCPNLIDLGIITQK